MVHNITILSKHFFAVLLVSLGICSGLFAQDDFIDYEAEKMVLVNYSIDNINEAFGKALVSLDSDFGSITLNKASTSVYFDLQLTYIEEEGDYAFEIYVDDELVDAWKSGENTGVYTDDVLNRVSHLTQNVQLAGNIEIVAYASNGQNCKIDKLGLRKTTIDNNTCNLTWGSDGAINSLVLGNTERISSGSTFNMSEFTGSKINSIGQVVESNPGQVIVFTDSYGFANIKFRVERYDYHVRIKMIGLECMPANDKSLCPVLTIPCSSSVGYELIDGNIEVAKSGNNLTLYWTKLADRGLTPGGYIALYASDEETEAKNEIAALESVEPPFVSLPPTDIFLSSSEITESNQIGDAIGSLSAADPEDDVASYSLTSGDGDDDNDKFIIIIDTLRVREVFDYETDSVYSVRVKVTDSQQNSYSKAFTIKILKDNSTAANNVFANNNVKIYPNPVSEELFIETKEACFIQIIDIEGRLIYFSEHTGIQSMMNTGSLAPGMYFVRLFNSKEQVIKKFEKE